MSPVSPWLNCTAYMSAVVWRHSVTARRAFVAAETTLERDTFKSAAEAKDFGLIDEVVQIRPKEEPVGK